MTLEAYIAFCLAAVAIVIVPGPTVTVVIANSLKYGAARRPSQCGRHAGGPRGLDGGRHPGPRLRHHA